MEINILDFIEQCRELAKQGWGSMWASPPAAGLLAAPTSSSTAFGWKKATATVKHRID
ncbi:hypothetical protein JCM31271_34190 [Halorubrum trueperi]